jgi:hypothetical protein
MKCNTLSAVLLLALASATAMAGEKESQPMQTIKPPSLESTVTVTASPVSTSTASQTQQASGSASASNAGNNASQSTEFNYPRQAPSTAQGSLMIGACGAGGNAGGSNSGGSAFLGITYTPADCKLLLAAAAYQALGMYDSACEMVNGIKAVKARWKALGVSPPSCQVKPPAPVATPPVTVNVTPPDLSHVATKDDLAGYVSKEEGRRIFERAVSK